MNEHGALILLTASEEVDQIIRLENSNLGEELLCRVTGLGPSFMGKMQVAVELIMPTPGFWSSGSSSKTPNKHQPASAQASPPFPNDELCCLFRSAPHRLDAHEHP